MSARTVEIDGEQWLDGTVAVDADGRARRLHFNQSSWGPAHDRWVWQAFGSEVELDLDAVSWPLTKVWPPDAPPTPDVEKPARKAAR